MAKGMRRYEQNSKKSDKPSLKDRIWVKKCMDTAVVGLQPCPVTYIYVARTAGYHRCDRVITVKLTEADGLLSGRMGRCMRAANNDHVVAHFFHEQTDVEQRPRPSLTRRRLRSSSDQNVVEHD